MKIVDPLGFEPTDPNMRKRRLEAVLAEWRLARPISRSERYRRMALRGRDRTSGPPYEA